MNKIKNDKYLRKNRGNTHSKHKTRKVQRGGQPVDATKVLLLEQSANNTNKMKEQSFPYVKEVMRKIKAWLIDILTPGTAESMKKLEELKKIEKRIESSENNQTVNENIDFFITEFKRILTSILQERLKELQQITTSTKTSVSNIELEGKIAEIDSILEKLNSIDKNNFTSVSKTLLESSKKILEKPSLTQRFNQGVSNMGKTVKSKLITAKDAVTSRFSRKKKSDNEDAEIELQELGSNENNSNQELTEPQPTETPRVNNEGRLAKMKTATKVGLGKVGTAFSNFRSRFTRKKEVNQNKYSPLPGTDVSELQPQAAGGKTRKNQQHQYIHEIKKNRNELFNKEMEILNSIRNFKNGHNDDTKKPFMKAVKRG